MNEWINSKINDVIFSICYVDMRVCLSQCLHEGTGNTQALVWSYGEN